MSNLLRLPFVRANFWQLFTGLIKFGNDVHILLVADAAYGGCILSLRSQFAYNKSLYLQELSLVTSEFYLVGASVSCSCSKPHTRLWIWGVEEGRAELAHILASCTVSSHFGHFHLREWHNTAAYYSFLYPFLRITCSVSFLFLNLFSILCLTPLTPPPPR